MTPMQPTHKDPLLEAQLASLFGFDRRDFIHGSRCVPPPIGCGGPATEFDDDQSRREFAISGLCQRCQDSVFGKADDDED